MSTLQKIKRIIGHRQYVDPIVDKNIYANLDQSYAGGSLAESNLLIVSNRPVPEELLNEVKEKECLSVEVIRTNGPLALNDIVVATNSLYGPFTHIVNIFCKNDDQSLLTADGKYSDKDDMYRLYQWLQIETEYQVCLEQYATICSVYIGDSSMSSKVMVSNMKMFISSLGDALGRHDIINNGFVAQSGVPMKEIINFSLFLSSKYGQVICGGGNFLKV